MDNKRRLAVNAIATSLAFAVQVGVNFVLTPYIIHTLGITAYGFIPLVNSIVGYSGIFTAALNSVASRFISLEYNRGDFHKANVYFASVLVADSILAVALAVPGALFSCFPQLLMDVPADLIHDVQLTFLFSVLGTELSLVLSVFGCVYYVRNCLDKSALRNIEGNAIRAGLLVALFVALDPKIYYVTATMLVVAVYNCIANLYYTRRMTPELGLRKARFSGKAVRELVAGGAWNSVNELSYVLLCALGIYLANLLVGARVTGEYSVAKTMPNFILNIIVLLASIFAPQAMQYYAKRRYREMNAFLLMSIKMTGLLYMLPIGYLLVFGTNFFEIWVPGQDAGFLQDMAALSLVVMMPSCTSVLLNNVFIITNRLKVPALVFLASGILNVVVVLVLAATTSWGIWTIIVVQGVIDIIKNAVIMPWYATKCIDIGRRELAVAIGKTYLCMVPMIAVCMLYKALLPVDSWVTLVISAAVCATVAGAACLFIVLNREERRNVFTLIRAKMGRAV
ncbi:lipopolysaccharide biosynthesis protein [Bifidobacterium sp. CP2]|uniref:lipopolysaccharide biosynthesis protein n=1 Tax=Bifidobacterium sp. CP2 TaxID=2809025 RepID=UPI001BDC4D18|nr:lipopolysaccharide biosynthesis protein [Bifidobacterium sp. CP2]MBT1182127.1 lipopolysaccharide biosynthesis protein [Bifidobacterium sp. CP2]